MKPEEVLKQFKEWNESGWSKSETPSSEALILAIQALEKQIPKKPIESEFTPLICPDCEAKIILGQRNCENCGQKIDWSDE